MTNWGDISTQQMARKQENRVREARFLANADSYMTEKSDQRSFARFARTIRQSLNRARTVAVAEPGLNLEPSQKPC